MLRHYKQPSEFSQTQMTTAGSQDAPIEIFGGLVTDMSPADLPHGASPDCQDVIFSNGGVATRPGMEALFGPLAGNPTVNYVKTYETLNATLRTMVLDSNGVLYKETTPGTLDRKSTRLNSSHSQISYAVFCLKKKKKKKTNQKFKKKKKKKNN